MWLAYLPAWMIDFYGKMYVNIPVPIILWVIWLIMIPGFKVSHGRMNIGPYGGCFRPLDTVQIQLVVVCHSCKLQWSSCDFVIRRCIIMDSGGSLDSSSIWKKGGGPSTSGEATTSSGNWDGIQGTVSGVSCLVSIRIVWVSFPQGI